MSEEMQGEPSISRGIDEGSLAPLILAPFRVLSAASRLGDLHLCPGSPQASDLSQGDAVIRTRQLTLYSFLLLQMTRRASPSHVLLRLPDGEVPGLATRTRNLVYPTANRF